jgi:hypothetical protein
VGHHDEASYTNQNPDKVEKLVLYAPQWLRSSPPLISGEGAYRTVSVDATRDRWVKGVPDDKKATLIPAGWFEQWAEATFATDPPTPLARTVFEKLVHAPYKRFVEIGEGTHTVIMEKNRMQLFREVQTFLEEPRDPRPTAQR